MQVEAAKQPMGRCSYLLPCGSSMCCSRRSLTLWFYRRAHGLIWRQFVWICLAEVFAGPVLCTYNSRMYRNIFTVHTHYFTLDGFSKCEHCSMHICKVSVGYCSGLHCFHAFSFVVLNSTALLSRSDQKSDELQETSRASKEFGHRAALFVSFPGLPGIAHFQTCAFDQGAAANCSVTSPS